MAIQTNLEDGNLWVIRVRGLLKKLEWEAVQTEFIQAFPANGGIRTLFILDEFEGWEGGADWGDVSFYLTHSDKFEKIAIVGDPKWEGHSLMFAGAGVRNAPVKYFPPDQEREARAWLG